MPAFPRTSYLTLDAQSYLEYPAYLDRKSFLEGLLDREHPTLVGASTEPETLFQPRLRPVDLFLLTGDNELNFLQRLAFWLEEHGRLLGESNRAGRRNETGRDRWLNHRGLGEPEA